MTAEIYPLTPLQSPEAVRRPVVETSRVATDTMNIVFFTHPDFLGHVSLPRFSAMLADGMRKRGHRVEILTPKARFYQLPLPKAKKWLGYMDQFLAFPLDVRIRLKKLPDNTLFVFTDNALGPWVPLVAHRPHVIHCHDFMAQESALNLIPENPTHWTGRQYQKLIFEGYNKGKNFISGSKNTQRVLQRFLRSAPTRSELVYNGLHQSFEPFDTQSARSIVSKETGLALATGYLMHVGGNQWYKNRVGVIEMYNAWRAKCTQNLPLILIGLPPSEDVLNAYNKSPFKNEIHFITNANDRIVNLAYSGATAFLFPSKAEGFGWPIAEAMASGCPVITTNEAPMTEVTGSAGFLIPRRPLTKVLQANWAEEAGAMINKVVNFSEAERLSAVRAGLENARRFDTQQALSQIEKIYLDILQR
ncbi:MAG TPA: glycosyltransferase [Chryseolinea sp.]|nr:glycosyltransferase [Chryseolinea sp.]